MPVDRRTLLAALVIVVVCAGSMWSLIGSDLPKADFTFVNESEVKSIDPALITGQPEGRIVYSIFEGLVNKDPKTLDPVPGVAQRWTISDDGLVYTFYLRDNAKWSDGKPVSAHDFHYSWRRFLDPMTAAEYAYQAWYIKNARNYSRGGGGIEPGDAVEVELNLPPGSINTLRGEVLQGKLVRIVDRGEDERDFVVEIDGNEKTFRPVDDVGAKNNPLEGMAWCRQVLLDFDEVGVKVLDDYTLEVTLENPTHFFLGLLGYYPLFPVPQHCIEKHGTPDWIKEENIVSNGPYRVEFRRIRDRIRMVKNEHYWNRENVKLETIDALAVESLTTALNLFLTGEVDWIGDLPPTAVREMMQQKPPRDDINPAPFLGSYFYYMQTSRPPLDDVRVRKALSMALDREEISKRLMPSGDPPSFSLVPPGIPNYKQQRTYPENVKEAQRLLSEAGYPEGHGFPRLEILTNTQESHLQIAELIRKQWQRNLGITVRTRNEEWGAYHSSLRNGQYDLARRGWIADYNDPNTFIDLFVTGGEQNSTGWSNKEYDRLVEAAAKELDPDKRYRMLEEAEHILLEELPILPIYSYMSKNMVKPYVRGFYNNLRDEHFVSQMWIDREGKEPNEFMRGQSKLESKSSSAVAPTTPPLASPRSTGQGDKTEDAE
jgi:oligopeptide transport system substrate-binding protein